MSPQRRDGEFMRRTAENYERYFVRIIGAPAAVDLVEAARLRPSERVLDAACDTGVVTKLAAEQVAPGGAFAGLDPNPALLAVARATRPSDKSIDWHEAPAEDLPFPDESFDAVLCGMGVQFFSDKEADPRKFHRVLVPGGRSWPTFLVPRRRPFKSWPMPWHVRLGPRAHCSCMRCSRCTIPTTCGTSRGTPASESVDVPTGVTALELPPRGVSVAIHLEHADRGHRGGGR